MIRLFIKPITLFLLTLLLITCSKDIVEPNGITELSSLSDGTEASEVYAPVEPIGLDFDALIREVEAEVDLYESNEYGARSMEARLGKEYDETRDWIINRIEKSKSFFNRDFTSGYYKGKTEFDTYEVPSFFSTPATRQAIVDKRIKKVYGVLTQLYKLDFLQYKSTQLAKLLYVSPGVSNDKKLRSSDYDCEDIKKIKIIDRISDNKWKSLGNLFLGEDSPYAKKNGKPKRITKGDKSQALTDMRQLKLKVEAVKYIKELVSDATPFTFYNNGRAAVCINCKEINIRRKLGWHILHDSNGNEIKTKPTNTAQYGVFSVATGGGKLKLQWYDGMDYKYIFGEKRWKDWYNTCINDTNSKYPVENCIEPYYERRVKRYSNELIKNSDFNNRKEECN